MRGSIIVILGTLVAGCGNDPVYIPGPTNLEAGMDDGAGGIVAEAKTQLVLPIETETPDDAAARADRTAALGIDVPYVKLGDLEVSVEWTIKNLDAVDGTARVELDGANELFAYDPDLIVLSTDDEAPPTPGLAGNIPIHVAANATVSGVFREDQLREASIDLDQITRANVNPFAAMLTVNKNDAAIQPLLPFDPTMPELPPMPDPDATAIPREAIAQIIRVDLVFAPTTHMVLDYAVRIRDLRGIVHDDLLAAPGGELQGFAPATFALMAAP
jgi:hypothetical protein